MNIRIILFILFAAFHYITESDCQIASQAIAGQANPAHELEFQSIPPGRFLMGADIGYHHIAAGSVDRYRSIFIQDEFPSRQVFISDSFDISVYEVTNAQYEEFDPDHSEWRGRFNNISSEDNEAVVYVSWEEAVAYTTWLSDSDPLHDYRLPTEAEWEYACRGGTKTPFNDGMTGDIYSLNPFTIPEMDEMNYQWPYPFTWSNGCRSWVDWRPEYCTGVEDVYPDKNSIRDADLTVGKGSPNGFGIYDMQGGVEEWVMDWYGFYHASDTVDPAGYGTGDFKVVRGGSHNNHVQHCRPANRMSAAMNDKHYLLGFRVVRVPEGRKPGKAELSQPERPWAAGVSPGVYEWQEDDSDP